MIWKIDRYESGFWLKCILLFFFIYEVALNGIPTLFSSRKFAYLMIFVVFIFEYQFMRQRRQAVYGGKIKEFFVFELMVTSFSYIWVLWRASLFSHHLPGGEAKNPIASIVYFVMIGLFGAIFLQYLFRSFKEFMRAITVISLWQCAFIFVEGISQRFKEILDIYIYNESVQYLQESRASGLGATGSWVSVLLFFGIFASGYFVLTEKSTIKYWLEIMVILLAQFFTGKTGLFCAIICIFYILWVKSGKFRHIATRSIKYGLVLLFVAIIGVAVLSGARSGLAQSLISNSVERLFSKGAYITESGGGFFGAFFSQQTVVPLSWDSLLGYGYSRNISINGVLYRHDSGYINRYVSDGLIMAAIEYLALLSLMLGVCKSIADIKLRKYVKLLIGLLFLIEIKEPYIYQYVSVAVVLGIAMKAGYQCRVGYKQKNDLYLRPVKFPFNGATVANR